MTLDVEFHQLMQRELEKTLARVIHDKKSDISKTWQCKNYGDFLYGWHMGKIDDFSLNQYFIYYHKTPTNEDQDKIQGILLVHANDFRDSFAK